MKLAIISHTEHYQAADGTIVGWGPTVSEINHLLEVFDTIYHVAMLHDQEPPPSALPYVSNKVIFVPLPALGGRSVGAKMQLLWKAPQVLRTIKKTLKQVDWFQFRAPTGIGVYGIPFLMRCIKTPGWFKYAGNWNQERPPWGYRLQRTMLKKQSRTVTINGSWPNQPPQCITFENPCLTEDELVEGHQLAMQKSIEGRLTCCYVGRLETPKGVKRIIDAVAALPEAEKQRIEVVHLVGDGAERVAFERLTKQIGVPFVFHGFLSRDKVFDIYKASQLFLMPTTASEGFPKAIAEAMNYGCLPVVSKISSIGQYIKHRETGFCIEPVTADALQKTIQSICKLSQSEYQEMIIKQRPIVQRFGFATYNTRIKTEILV